MSVGGLLRCVALMVVLAWMLWPYAPRGRALLPVSSRVPRAGRKTGAGDAVRDGRVMGLSGVIAHMSSSVRAGGMISGVLADVDGSGFAGMPLTASRLKRLLMRQRMPGESAAQAEHVAFELAVACAMCERSGCSLADCLDVVGENHRISRLLHDSRRSAFAVPRATAALLGALPLVTISLGELLGARPVQVLFGSAQGNACLAVGGAGYALGLLWMSSMMRNTGTNVDTV